MKKVILLTILAYCASVISAQETAYNYTSSSNELSITADFPNIELIESSDGKIHVQVIAFLNDIHIPEMVKLNWDSQNQRLKAVTDHEKSEKYRKKIQENQSEDDSYYGNCFNYRTKLTVSLPKTVNKIFIRTIHGKVKAMPVPSNITDVNIKSDHGNVELVFNQHETIKKISVHSDHGLVDVSLPQNSNFDISARTDFGDIYSDLNLDYKQKKNDMRHFNLSNLEVTLNGGGPPIDVSSDHADLYLRKSK